MATDDSSCSTREAAQALGICVRTAQLWVEQGRLRAWKTPGGHRRILRESVNEELRARERACGGGATSFDVLVVDDEPMLRQILQRKISEIAPDLSLRVACDGVEGLIHIGERQPNLLITDLMMPGLDGFHLLAKLTSSPLVRPMQIIVVTGLSDEEIQEGGGLPEGVVVFRKPLQLSMLVAMVRAYHHGWSLQRKVSGLADGDRKND